MRNRGLKNEPVEIKAAAFVRTIGALIATAERATRLLATGTGRGGGAPPKWLRATTDFTIQGFGPGSTICDIKAPTLRETAADAFAEGDLWGLELSLEDTALDFAARAIREAKSKNPTGDYFDSSVLTAIGSFGNAVREREVSYQLTPESRQHEHFELNSQSSAQIKARLKDLQPPRAFVVSGRLDEIKHGSRRFSLLVNKHTRLLGRFLPTSLEVETLRPLWGKNTTVEGIVHFKANGESRLIEARRISERLAGDSVFEEVPSIVIGEPDEVFSLPRKTSRAFDPIELAGAWPGDEPLEYLLAQLD